MKPEYEGMLRTVTQWSRWTYKDKMYQVRTVTPGMLSQDAEGEWSPTVIYSNYDERLDSDTYIHVMDLRFARPITEFVKKFTLVVEEAKTDATR